jgi:hypothetical protein
MKDCIQTKTRENSRLRSFRRGEWVEVRAIDEIQATLDAEGKLDGLPFMPEMAKYCGRKFCVSRRADRIFLDRYCYVVRLRDTVFLDMPRCDGQSHANCQMGCELFWKESWLKPVDSPIESDAIPIGFEMNPLNLSTLDGQRFICQATELVRASTKLPWWDLRQYVREVMLGETSVGKLIVDLIARAGQKISRIVKPLSVSAENPITQPTPTECLNLQAGEWVEVKSLPDIQSTLDANGRNRGLGFAPDQAEFCGKRYRVAGRVEKIILEWSGEMRPIANTVELVEVTCHGRMCRSCPRNCYHLWREIWLRRVSGPK